MNGETTMMFDNITDTGWYEIIDILNHNPKFSGLGILSGNQVNVLHLSNHLIRFRINNTDMFARRADIKARLKKI